MAVLIVVTIAAMVGTTALYVGDGEIAATRTTVRATQSRALAWSAVQMAMTELLAQRDALLDGGRAELTREFAVGPAEPGARAIARFIEIVPGEIAVPESGKLDLNTATAEMLVATGLLDATVAGRIVAAARERPLASVEELLGLEGVTAEMVYGGGGIGGGGVGGGGPSVPGTRAVAGGTSAPTTRLGDVLTAYAFDPNIQAGVGARGADHRGKKRINISAEWSDSLGQAVSNRFGKDAAKVLEQVMKGGTKFAKSSDVVAVLRRLNVPPAEWGTILDTFTTSEDDYLIGLVDLSSASAAVLACVPGISTEAAGQIVRDRERLGADAKRSVVWPVTGGILDEEQFQKAADYLTTRCMQWRIRVEAGYLKASERSASNQPPPSGMVHSRGEKSAGPARQAEASEGRLSDRVVYEAVIDVSSLRPRVAYLRDVSMLPGAYAMYQTAALARQGAALPVPVQPDEGLPEETPPEDRGARLKLDTDLKFDALDFSQAGEKSRQQGQGADPTVSADGSAPASGRDSATKDDVGAAASPAGGAGTHGSSPVDRRIGRWTTGSRGSGGGGS